MYLIRTKEFFNVIQLSIWVIRFKLQQVTWQFHLQAFLKEDTAVVPTCYIWSSIWVLRLSTVHRFCNSFVWIRILLEVCFLKNKHIFSDFALMKVSLPFINEKTSGEVGKKRKKEAIRVNCQFITNCCLNSGRSNFKVLIFFLSNERSLYCLSLSYVLLGGNKKQS